MKLNTAEKLVADGYKMIDRICSKCGTKIYLHEASVSIVNNEKKNI